MINKVRETIKKYSMISAGDTVTVGLSGGADSVCLLHILLELSRELDFTVKAAHINHGIRGEEADRDEEFVRRLCEENSVGLAVFHKNIPLEAEKTGESEEECGRRIRYECFSSLGGKIATAHSLTDSVETTVFNLIRGSSLKGACGIPAVRSDIIRPLIECGSEEIRAYCRENGYAFVTDSTNLETQYTRNFIRQEILPRFERINPGYDRALSRFQTTARRDNELLDKIAREFSAENLSEAGFECDKLAKADTAIRTRVISEYIRSVSGADPEFKHIEFISGRMGESFGIQLNSEYTAGVKDGFFRVYKNEKAKNERFCLKLKIGTNETPTGNIEISVSDRSEINFNKKDTDSVFVCNIDYDKIDRNTAVIRSRNDGDKITLAKRGVTKSLKKLYNELKIPTSARNSVPVIADGEKVIWVFGAGYNKKCEITQNTTKIMTIKAEEDHAQRH